MHKKIIALGLVFCSIMVLSCKKEENKKNESKENPQPEIEESDTTEKVKEPEIVSYASFVSPVYVLPGTDTVKVYGENLTDAKIILENFQDTILGLSTSSDSVLAFITPQDFNTGTLSFLYADTTKQNLPVKLYSVPANDTRRNVDVLLISDFDNSGIRPITTGIDFIKSTWDYEGTDSAIAGIHDNYNGNIASPEGGNYFYSFAPDGKIEGQQTSGWGGRFNSRNQIMSNGQTQFPMSLADYPNSPLNFEGDASDYYLNFYYKTSSLEDNRNGENPAAIRIFLVDPRLPQNQYFAFSISNGENMPYAESIPMPSDEDWHGVSISLTRFQDNYGFGGSKGNLDNGELKSFNAIRFVFWDSRVDAVSEEINGVSNDEERNSANGPVAVFLDHVSISKGSGIYTELIL